jgi:hypothetical protein
MYQRKADYLFPELLVFCCIRVLPFRFRVMHFPLCSLSSISEELSDKYRFQLLPGSVLGTNSCLNPFADPRSKRQRWTTNSSSEPKKRKIYYLLRHICMALMFPNLGAVCQSDMFSVSWRRGQARGAYLQRTSYCKNIRRNYI